MKAKEITAILRNIGLAHLVGMSGLYSLLARGATLRAFHWAGYRHDVAKSYSKRFQEAM